MKSTKATIWFLIALLLIFESSASNAQDNAPPKSTSKINVLFDRDKDLTTISIKPMIISRLEQEKKSASSRDTPLLQMDVGGSLTYTGQGASKRVKDVSLQFHAVAGNYYFLKPQEIIVAIDRDVADKGRAFSLGLSTYKSLAPKFNTVYEEYFDLAIPADALRKFAAAGTLEFFVGPVVYKLTPKQLDSFKEWETFLPK